MKLSNRKIFGRFTRILVIVLLTGLLLPLGPARGQEQFPAAANDALFTDHLLTPDTVPPTAPGAVTASGITDHSLNLQWTAATDHVGVVGYDVFVGNTLATSVVNSTYSYTLTGLAQDTLYSLSVKARDGAGNVSVAAGISVRTEPIKAGDALVVEGTEYVAKYTKKWSFNTDGKPWAGDGPTWDGFNAGWEPNPFNGNDPAMSLTLRQNSNGQHVQKSQRASLGFTAAQLQEVVGKENVLVRVQLRRWQPDGWDAGSFIYWSMDTDTGTEWKDLRYDTMKGSAANGETENYYYSGTDRRFTSDNGHVPVGVFMEWDQASWNKGLPVGTKTYIDDISWTIYVNPQGERPAAPTAPVVNNVQHTFGWTYTAGYGEAFKYEYSLDSGSTWQTATANPQPVGNVYRAAGAVQVRVKAEASTAGLAGYVLLSDKTFVRQAVRGIAPGTEGAETLWRIGLADASAGEFGDFASGGGNVSIPADWATRTGWLDFAKGLKADTNGSTTLTFHLEQVPAYGLRFSFKTLDAYKSTPQLAVYANGIMAGLVQVAGINGSNAVDAQGLPLAFKETYQLYIPKELLVQGANTLKLQIDRGLYADSSGDPYLWLIWDYLKLERLTEEAVEPLHGRYIHMGTNISDVFAFSNNQARMLPQLTEWLGIAYSGNWMRLPFWSGGPENWSSDGRNYLLTLRELNLNPLMDYFGGEMKDNAQLKAGTVPASIRQGYEEFVAKFGDLYTDLEIQNEPGLFGWSQSSILALAQYLQETKGGLQPSLRIIAPGWAYWPTNGTPAGWERDPAQRRPIEELSDMTNGHSYGGSGVSQARGGVLPETLLTYPEGNGSIPKEMVISETGGNDKQVDSTMFGTYNNRYAAVFDREMRANIAYADHIIQHAAFFKEGSEDPVVFGLFNHNINWNTHRPEETVAWPNNHEAGETRLKTFRRLAAAYATHGTPLAYDYTVKSAVMNKKVIFRAVDTSGLGTSATGASSDKVLLNFVSFEKEPVTVSVYVRMPEAAVYTGSRYGEGDAYAQAMVRIGSLQTDAGGYLTLEETVNPGETIQYILAKKDLVPPSAPAGLTAEAVSYKQIRLSWSAAADNAKIAGYYIYRGGERINTVPAAVRTYSDFTVAPLSAYTYKIQAFDESYNVSGFSPLSSASTPAEPKTPGTAIAGGMRYEAEAAELGRGVTLFQDAAASGGTGIGNTQGGPVTLMNIDTGAAGSYVLTIRYASAEESKKQITVNGVNKGTFTFPKSGGWNGSGMYREMHINMQLNPTRNVIEINAAGGGTNMDYFELKPGEYIPTPAWTTVPHDSSYIEYAGGFAANISGASHDSATAGATAQFAFKGTGFSWYSRIQSNMGSAEVYVDGELYRTVNIPEAGLEGFDREILSVQGLEDGLHQVRVQVKQGTVAVNSFRFLSLLDTPVMLGADLVVTGVFWSPEFPEVGEAITLHAVVKNTGTKATPEGNIVGGIFRINGGTAAWTDTYNLAIQPGESVTLTANSSSSGSPTWLVPAAGTYRLGFLVNDIHRFSEMDFDNNYLEETLYTSEPQGQ